MPRDVTEDKSVSLPRLTMKSDVSKCYFVFGSNSVKYDSNLVTNNYFKVNSAH
jgi:hypothetical protein